MDSQLISLFLCSLHITAFGEAVGDVIALSVMTPEHLRKINLINSTTDDHGKGPSRIHALRTSNIIVFSWPPPIGGHTAVW